MSASISQSLFVAPAPAPASKSGPADRSKEATTDDGGFADALDEAGAADAAPSPENSDAAGSGAAQSEPSRREPASPSLNSSQNPSPEAEAAALTADPALAPLTPPPTALVDPDTAATAAANGWPPPGLSSLFPDGSLFANPPSATVTVSGIAAGRLAPQGGSSASGSAPILSMAAETLPLAPLPAEPLGPGRGPALAPLSQGMAAPALAAPPDAAMAAALARQPAALLIPNLDEDARGLMAVGETASSDRSDSLSPLGFAPLSASSASASRLDLSQAFPAPVPMPSPKFAEDLGARLQWMAGQQGGDATLRIAPDGLGPVEIRLRLDGDRVELGFLAAQQDTRQALQDALPKLREMLAQQGLQLGHADVGQRQSSNASGNPDGERRKAFEDEGDGGTRGVTSEKLPAPRVVIGSGRGMLDLYA